MFVNNWERHAGNFRSSRQAVTLFVMTIFVFLVVGSLKGFLQFDRIYASFYKSISNDVFFKKFIFNPNVNCFTNKTLLIS